VKFRAGAQHVPCSIRLECEPERALIEVLLARYQTAVLDGAQRFVAVTASSWLPKQLLQASRSFRSVGIYLRVRALQEALEISGIPAWVVGPCRMPPQEP
jgi:hypothetical protein